MPWQLKQKKPPLADTSLRPIPAFPASIGLSGGVTGGWPLSRAKPLAKPSARAGNAGMRAVNHGRGRSAIEPLKIRSAHSGFSLPPSTLNDGISATCPWQLAQFASADCRIANSAKLTWPSDALPSRRNSCNAARLLSLKANAGDLAPSGLSARQPLAKSSIAGAEKWFSSLSAWQFRQPVD